VEVSALKHIGSAGLRGPTPLLRLQSDERLVALTRRGNQGAYEALVARYQSRLLSFCRHMLGSNEDAEDVLQEVFAAAFNAMLADDRPINVRPWLYRIARNRCLNHLRRQTAIGVDSMDVHLADHGTTTADRVHEREKFRELIADVQTLAETQRTALLLREIEALSYEQIAEAMETTVPSVKSLLVRARVALAEAAQARQLTCEDVRLELGEWAEGLTRLSPPVRRHLRSCDRCAELRRQLKQANKALAALFPVGPLLFLKKLLLSHGAGSAAVGASGATATGAVIGSATTSGALTAGVGAIATKAAAGLAAVAFVTTGAVEVERHHDAAGHRAAKPVAAATAVVAAAPTPSRPSTPVALRSEPQPAPAPTTAADRATPAGAAEHEDHVTASTAAPATVVAAEPPVTSAVPDPAAPPEQVYDSTTLPPQPEAAAPAAEPIAAPPAEPAPLPAVAPAPAPSSTTPPAPAGDVTTAPASGASTVVPAEPAPPADPPATTGETSAGTATPAQAEPAQQP
jgi:RNA polymerase sigma factor (sigma-70 family)